MASIVQNKQIVLHKLGFQSQSPSFRSPKFIPPRNVIISPSIKPQQEKESEEDTFTQQYQKRYFNRRDLKNKQLPKIKTSSLTNSPQTKNDYPLKDHVDILFDQKLDLNSEFKVNTQKTYNNNKMLQKRSTTPSILMSIKSKVNNHFVIANQKKYNLNKIDEECDSPTSLNSDNDCFNNKNNNKYQRYQEQSPLLDKYEMFGEKQKEKLNQYIKEQDANSLETLFKERMEDIIQSFKVEINNLMINQEENDRCLYKMNQLEKLVKSQNRKLKKYQSTIDSLHNQIYQERQSFLSKPKISLPQISSSSLKCLDSPITGKAKIENKQFSSSC